MRYLNETATINNSGTTTTAAVDASMLAQASVQAVFTDGTAAGTLKLQASNDAPSAAGPAHWNDVPSTSQTVASGATTLIPVTTLAYRWIRVSFASSAGAGTVAITLQAQGY